MYNITTRLTQDFDPVYLFFIDSEGYDQKGYKTKEEAFAAGMQKVKELKKRSKK